MAGLREQGGGEVVRRVRGGRHVGDDGQDQLVRQLLEDSHAGAGHRHLHRALCPPPLRPGLALLQLSLPLHGEARAPLCRHAPLRR